MKNKFKYKINQIYLHILKYNIWDWNELRNLPINKYFVKHFINKPWENYFKDIDFSQIITNNFINTFSTECEEKITNYNLLSLINDLNLNFIDKNINKPWDYKNLSKNINLTLEFIYKHNDKPWDYNELDKNYFNNKVKESINLKYQNINDISYSSRHEDYDNYEGYDNEIDNYETDSDSEYSNNMKIYYR